MSEKKADELADLMGAQAIEKLEAFEARTERIATSLESIAASLNLLPSERVLLAGMAMGGIVRSPNESDAAEQASHYADAILAASMPVATGTFTMSLKDETGRELPERE